MAKRSDQNNPEQKRKMDITLSFQMNLIRLCK